MLHIHNGDSSANTAKQSPVPGEHFAFRESLVTGPTPSGLSAEEWRRTRSHHLSESYGLDPDKCERDLVDQQRQLATYVEHEEVVLWFEHDLFCQVHLIYLLNWFAQQPPAQTKLSLICINKFPGKDHFRGLGELNSDELASLFPARNEVTNEQLRLAGAAWSAYSSTNPIEMERVLDGDTNALPFIDATLRAHLRRFPSTSNGLGRVEQRGLELILDGCTRFAEMFRRFNEVEPFYGFGDLQFWLALERLAEATRPLVAIENENGARQLPAHIVHNARFSITDLGHSVLKAETDFVESNGIDVWLGGVHLEADNSRWRWNEERGTLIAEE